MLKIGIRIIQESTVIKVRGGWQRTSRITQLALRPTKGWEKLNARTIVEFNPGDKRPNDWRTDSRMQTAIPNHGKGGGRLGRRLKPQAIATAKASMERRNVSGKGNQGP